MARECPARSCWRPARASEAGQLLRIITGLALASSAWVLIFRAPAWALVAGLVLTAILALREFFAIAEELGRHPFRIAGHASVLLWLLVPNLDRGLVSTVLPILFLSAGMLARKPVADALPSAAVTLFGVIYVAGPTLCAILLYEVSPHWLGFLAAVVACADSGALGVGRAWGRHPVAPVASPHKTWEGTLGGLLVGGLAGAGYAQAFLPGELGWLAGLALGLVLSVASQFGDLAESVMKRAASVKDSGTILPGHGGVLDRVDGLLFAAPTAYCYVTLVH